MLLCFARLYPLVISKLYEQSHDVGSSSRMILPVRAWIGPHANGWPQRISNPVLVNIAPASTPNRSDSLMGAFVPPKSFCHLASLPWETGDKTESRQPSIQRSHGRQKRQSGIIPSQHHGRQREAKQDHLSAASWGTKGDRAESSQPSIQEEPWIKRDKGGHCRIILAQDCFYARIENPFLAKLLGEKLGKPNTSPKHRSY